MSLESKLAAAAKNAVMLEKTRILLVLDLLKKRAQKSIESTILTPAQMHAARVKLAITVHVIELVRTIVITNSGPSQESTNGTRPNPVD